MSLKRWTMLAEITSSVAVIVSLVILIIEIRGNTAAVQANSRQSQSGRFEALLLSRTDPLLALVLDKAARGEELTNLERIQYTGWLGAHLRNLEEAFLQFQDGRLDQEYLDSRLRALIVAYFTVEENREIFRAWREDGIYTEEFAAWFGQAIDEAYGSD